MQIRLVILFLTCIITMISCKHKVTSDFQEPDKTHKGFLILNTRACYFADADSIEKKTHLKIDTPSCREIEQMQSIMDYAGLPQNFKIYRGNIDNALATVVDKQRLIIYNKDLFTTMDELSSSYWTSLFIIAHEIGHHLANNISDTAHLLQSELDADRFAGFILFRMGADSNQVIEAVASGLISTTHDSKTHPSKSKRIEAVKKSWRESYDLRYLSATPPPIQDNFSEAFGKPFNDDPTQNNLNGFPTAYNPRGYNDYQLINNAWVLSQLNPEYVSLYSGTRTADSSIYSFIPNISRNYHGIIVDVQKQPGRSGFDDCVLLNVGILITKIDTAYNYAGLSVNQRYPFLVCFTPRGFTQDILSYYNFFAGGRRLEFDILDLHKKEITGGLLTISRAYSL